MSSPRNPSSQLVKTYRQAANLFLTRRLPEALSTLDPLVTPPSPSSDDDPVDRASRGESEPQAPIATAPKGIRLKVWILYVTLLNAVVELGSEEGKHAFGFARWKALVGKARDGTIWEDVVQIGYGGEEGNVDAEVVVNLATLLLAHSPSQTLNQERLEAYLAAMANPTLDVEAHMSNSQNQQQVQMKRRSGSTDTPRDLATTIKLLELYTLHVLPRNGEWDYAKEFISMNGLLDEERKEAFLQALVGLKEEQEHAAKREKEIQKAQLEQLEKQRQEEEEEQRRQQQAAKREEERKKEDQKRREQQLKKQPESISGNRPKPFNTRAAGIPGGTASRPRPGAKKDGLVRREPMTLVERMGAVVGNIQSLILATTLSIKSNPLMLLRTVLFVMAFAIAFGRREVRARVRRALKQGWSKVKGTVGMGIKVSSI
jgi:hypothetical protein